MPSAADQNSKLTAFAPTVQDRILLAEGRKACTIRFLQENDVKFVNDGSQQEVSLLMAIEVPGVPH